MEMTKVELDVLQAIELENTQGNVTELLDLQLTLIGGGNSVDIFH